ncbi:hypothetical protein [Actinomycetospora lemnae]|uniref:ATP synthase protein I n=1 Tax=Actinomycetospora lemnae TaxID=3019891 RepID=A0ABT5SXW8_9PSEU|nr:hypothetical protein [Actinomycetospora sp. DW7H6]MDD7967710.1 hypothetical protein [Actinomycetospora sp. DW7H6]
MTSPDSPNSADSPRPTPAGTPHATPATTAQVLEASSAMLRGGLWPAVVVAVLAAVVAGLLAGVTGVVAAVVGAVVVIGVCSLGPLVMRWTAAADPMVVMAAALVSMMGKLGLLLVVFLVLQALEVVDTRIAALALGPTAIAFIVGEVIAYARKPGPTIAV